MDGSSAASRCRGNARSTALFGPSDPPVGQSDTHEILLCRATGSSAAAALWNWPCLKPGLVRRKGQGVPLQKLEVPIPAAYAGHDRWRGRCTRHDGAYLALTYRSRKNSPAGPASSYARILAASVPSAAIQPGRFAQCVQFCNQLQLLRTRRFPAADPPRHQCQSQLAHHRHRGIGPPRSIWPRVRPRWPRRALHAELSFADAFDILPYRPNNSTVGAASSKITQYIGRLTFIAICFPICLVSARQSEKRSWPLFLCPDKLPDGNLQRASRR